MERLTERDTNGTAMAACCGENCKHNFCCESGGFAECGDMDDIIDRLAAIEDILGDDYDLDRLRELLEACKGLEPSEIAESKLLIATRKDPEKLARMAELVEADRDGRCVVLPCKVGDTIYRVVHYDDGSGYAVWTIRVNFVEFNDNDSIELPNYVIGTTENGAGTTMEFSDFGKTAFTTREAAEEALKARKQE